MDRGAGVELERLAAIMARLRGERGCPWDREQNLGSLRPYLIEEAYEVLEEMDRVVSGAPWAQLCEELGDLLFQIVFQAQLASEERTFTLADVCRVVAQKIEVRHPHVFGDLQVSGSAEVSANWVKIKAEEKRRLTGSPGSVLDGVPEAAPSLLRAERLTEKASQVGFDWPDLAGVRQKLDEELGELDQAIASGKREDIEHELGDVLFSLANLGRFLRTPAEDALRGATRRFVSRFHEVESALRREGILAHQATLAKMEELWQRAKRGEEG
jgi:ATP diphosphatase